MVLVSSDSEIEYTHYIHIHYVNPQIHSDVRSLQFPRITLPYSKRKSYRKNRGADVSLSSTTVTASATMLAVMYGQNDGHASPCKGGKLSGRGAGCQGGRMQNSDFTATAGARTCSSSVGMVLTPSINVLVDSAVHTA